MSLSCGCDSWGDDADEWYTVLDPAPLATKRSRSCMACKVRIPVGQWAYEVMRTRGPGHEIEERIYGDQVPMGSKWLCEDCGDIQDSLMELGICTDLGQPMREQMAEFHELYGKPGFVLKTKATTREIEGE